MPENNRATANRDEYDEAVAAKSKSNHLLIIGIDQYSNGIPKLNNAVRDAKNFRDLLLKNYQFPKDNLTCLFNKKASRANIISTFSQLLDKLTEEDNLIFYYSGHGEQVKKGKGDRGYWIPADAQLGKDWSYIPNDEITLLFKNSRAHHVFGIVDSCFSGSLFQNRNLTTAEDRIYSYPSRWLLTAGRLEPVSDGSLGKNSPFATALLTYLKNYPNDRFWVSDLCNQVLKGMEYNTAKQTPRGEPLQEVGHLGGQFVFYKKGVVPQKETIDFTPSINEAIQQKGLEDTAADPGNKDIIIATPTSFTELIEQLKLLAATDLERGLKQYKAFIRQDSSKEMGILLQLGQYNGNKNQQKNGLISNEEANRTNNRIRYALISMIKDLKEGDIQL